MQTGSPYHKSGVSGSTGQEGPLPRREVRHLRTVFTCLYPYRLRVALACLAIVFSTAAVLGMGGALRYMVDKGLHGNNVHLLDRAYAMLVAVIGLLALATYTRYYLVAWLGERVVADIRRKLYAHIVQMHIGFFETARTGDLLSRLTTDTTLLQTVIGSTIPIAMRNILLLTGGFALLLFTSPRLTAYVFGMLPLVVAPILVIGRRVRAMSKDAQAKVAEMNAHAEETIGGIRTVQAMTMESMEKARFGQHVDAAMNAALNRIRLRSGLVAAVISLVFGAVVTVLWVGGRDVMNGSLTPGQLSSFVFYAVLVAGAVGALSEVFAELQRAAGAAERIDEMMQFESTITVPEKPAGLPESRNRSITFENVTFTYPARPDRPAAADISLTITPGETVALVGPSGAGKTTLFQLILRFYDPQSGRILLSGADIRSFDPAAYRRIIGLVPQDPVIFSADAMTNIRAGHPDATDDEVIAAARAARALEFLERLPEGLNTHLGEKGVRLSGGQRQRLAIARALVRDPDILLLDEATSALDAENEHLVQDALRALMQGRTTLVIAHRLSTVVHASRIVFMEEGRIEAIGTHEELLERHAAYAHLASLQFQHAA